MEPQLRQRIIGIVVLIILAIVLIPLVLTSSKKRPPQEVVTPTQPLIAPQTEQKPVQTTQPQTTPTPPVEVTPPEKMQVAPVKPAPIVTPKPVVKPAPVIATPPVEKPKIVPTQYHKPVAVKKVTHHGVHKTHKAIPVKAWTVQLGSFTNQINANHLAKRLKAKGFHVYTRTAKEHHISFTEIFVGPELEKSAAEKLVANLRKEFNLNGIVVEYHK